MPETPPVRELRLVVTATDYDEALRFYREVLGLPELAAFSSPGGRVSILSAGRATLELADPPHAAYVDEVEVGRRVAGHIRVAFQVPDSRAGTAALAAAGARVLAQPTRTPWDSLNSRLEAPAGLQLTLFCELRDPAEEAAATARDAAARYGLRVLDLDGIAEHREVARLLARIWRTPDGQDPIAAETVRALAHSGNYVAGAYHGDRLVGAAVGFRGADGQGASHLHSHITGVDRQWPGAGAGYALKQHQRAWSVARGIDEVQWTFDPLVRRNAYFNLHKLGATAPAYLTDFYGPMTDGINAGDASDRLQVSWLLTAPRAVAAARGERCDVDAAAYRTAGAAVLVDLAPDGERPVPGGGLPADGRPVLVAVPPDIEDLRSRDAALADRWRLSVREALAGALASGYQIAGISRDGFYALARVSP
jgi:predicted GNAT superfamily acetyltransferase/predicted enzyme related to lactoylglutathione lyase